MQFSTLIQNANGQTVEELTGVPLPPRPSEDHSYNYAKRVWEDTRTNDRVLEQIRAQRDTLIGETDWLVIKAGETGGPTPQNWKTYRQALRDITKQPDMRNVTWPKKPD